MEFRKFEGKRVRLIDIDGNVFEGVVGDYVFPEDNTPEEEAIILDSPNHNSPIQFNSSEIKSITEMASSS